MHREWAEGGFFPEASIAYLEYCNYEPNTLCSCDPHEASFHFIAVAAHTVLSHTATINAADLSRAVEVLAAAALPNRSFVDGLAAAERGHWEYVAHCPGAPLPSATQIMKLYEMAHDQAREKAAEQERFETGTCKNTTFGPVLAGLDFVDLLEKKTESVDKPEFGSSSITAELNGYTFWFKSSTNRDKFTADPWAYAPAQGGFCAYGMAYEGSCAPSANIWDAVYTKYGNQTHMLRGQGPYNLFVSSLPNAMEAGQRAFEKCYGSDKSKWPFNTACCAYKMGSTTCALAPTIQSAAPTPSVVG